MNHPRRSPADVGMELWDLAKGTADEGMVRKMALDHMSAHQFEVAKVWDRDEMCPLANECFLYALGRYFVSLDPRLSVLAVSRELHFMHHRAVRLECSAVAPLIRTDHVTPQLQVVHKALADVIKATAAMRGAGFSAEMAVRLQAPTP
ncbi:MULTISPECIES: hypothetical protein [unclassified Streptomyces]|uniref:hypothetical protein n=1 Tax=unclassified Streptomyces TaxID=2593676 RepID=UPI0038289464